MGDDSGPRVVNPGSLAHGRSVMYRITPRWDGATPFTVNGSHILVLRNCVRPCKMVRDDGGWDVVWYELKTDKNEMMQRWQRFESEAAADMDVSCRLELWTALEWEVSVDDFLAAPADVRASCQLFQSGPVTFQSPQQPSLHHILSIVLHTEASTAQVEWAAWYLGMWITDGVKRCDWITQGGPLSGAKGRHYENVLRLHDYSALFGEQVQQMFDRWSSAGNGAFNFQFGFSGVHSVAHRLLQSYGLINNKHIPQAWICDTIEVRRRIFAGILDGDGCYSEHSNCYVIAAQQRHVMAGYKLLAASLGIRNEQILRTRCVNPETEEVYDGFRANFTGEMSDIVQYRAQMLNWCPQSGAADYVMKNNDSRCYGFSITALDVGEYYGFAVTGTNRRFLLEDFTVTHNVSSHTALH
jgi:Hom_end-associated Hint/Homing endonuclease